MSMRIGISADLRDPSGTPVFGHAALEALGGAPWEWLTPQDVLEPGLAHVFDALYINTPRVAAASLPPAPSRLRIVARHGVGYDSVDIPACTRAGVLVTIQPEGVRRPLAVAALTLVLALSQRLLVKDRLVRAGRWHERTDHMGVGLTGRTLGVVGAGNVGRELLALARPFGLRLLAADPAPDHAALQALGCEVVPLPRLLADSDFVVVLAPLTPATHGLIAAAELARMRPEAFLINVARGPVVDEAALLAALRESRIAGAGLDVFTEEPVGPEHALLALENVIVTPHALCWTDECFDGLARSGLASIRAMLDGGVPANAVNPEAARAR